MSEDLKRLGALIKARRKEKNLTLKEVENSTSVRIAFLEAIEEGTLQQQVAGIYAVGFLKQYGNFLGVDVEKMMKENPSAFQVLPEKHEFDYGIGTLEVRGSLSGGVKWLPSLLWGGTSALILFLAWLLARTLGIF